MFRQKISLSIISKNLHRENLTDLDSVEIEPEDPFADPGAAMITREMNLKLKVSY